MSHRDNKEPNDFSKKVRNQGTTDFGAAPWSDPAKIGVKTRPAAMPPGNNRTRSGAVPVEPGKHVPCRLGDRILTGLAIMSLGMLIVGAMGAYLSQDSQRVATTTRSESGASAGFLHSPDTRSLELERKLTQLTDLYGERLHTLETEVAQTLGPYAARLTNVESRLETSGDPGAAHLRDLANRLAQFNPSGYEARLTMLENRLDQAYAPYHAELRDMESRMGQGYASTEARLREIENRMMQMQFPYEQRLQTLEQKLIYASARLDHLSAEMESLVDNNTAIIEASATLQTDPPAAMPVSAYAPVDASGSPWFPPSPAMNKTALNATADEAAGGSGNPVAPTAVATPNAAIRPAVSPPSTDIVQDMPAAGEQTPDMTADPDATRAIAPAPETLIARAGAPLTGDEPVESARKVGQDSLPGQPRTGDWVINLASYASETIAAQKLADFRRKGVSAEQSVATVNGKTIYRVRIAGFDSRKSATTRAEAIRQQLGLKETWITRQ